jgi:hypothetical protein
VGGAFEMDKVYTRAADTLGEAVATYRPPTQADLTIVALTLYGSSRFPIIPMGCCRVWVL